MLQRCLCTRTATQSHQAGSRALAAAIHGARTAHASSSLGASVPALPNSASGAPAGGLPLPLVDEITSTSSAYVKHCVRLRESAKYRQEQQRLLVVGRALLQELADAHQDDLPARVLFVQRGRGSSSRDGAANVPQGITPQHTIAVSEAVMRKLTGLNSVDSIGAVAELDMPQCVQLLPSSTDGGPASSIDSDGTLAAGNADASSTSSRQLCSQDVHNVRPSSSNTDASFHHHHHDQQQQQSPQPSTADRRQVPVLRRLLALEGVQDPGNMGTLLRSALAFGWDAAWLLPGCCDPFNDKALRASRGAALRLPLASGSWEQLREVAAARQLVLLAAEPEEGEEEEEGRQGWQRKQQARRVGHGHMEQQRRQQQQPESPLLRLAQKKGRMASIPSADGADARGGSNSSGTSTSNSGPPGNSDNAASSTSGQQAVCLVLGSEGRGLSREALDCCQAVAIPMVPGQMESLNVGIAGGILMFVLSDGLPKLLRRVDKVHRVHGRGYSE